MYSNENFRKTVKIFIFTLMCCLLDSSFTQQNATQNRSPYFTRTANGTQVNTENAKFLASIRLKAFDKIFGDGHICSGALVAPSVVLTAAQCIHNYNKKQSRHPSEFKIVMGTINRYELNPDTLTLSVTHIYESPSFDAQSLKDDVAILMLDQDVPHDHPIIQPIAFNLATPSEVREGLENSHEYISWATNKEGLPLDQAILFNASQSSKRVCFEQRHPAYAGPGTLCIAADQKNAKICPSDAGAPLIFNNQLQGLVSVGYDCSFGRKPAIFTDIPYHSKWILSKIGDGSNQNSCMYGSLAFILFTLYTIKTSKIFKACW